MGLIMIHVFFERYLFRLFGQHSRTQTGFTLLELIIAMSVGLIVAGSIYSVYTTQIHLDADQRIKTALQQNLRSAMIVMEQEIRMIGFDPEDTGQFGIVNVRRYDLIDPEINSNGSPALFYTVDEDENGELDPGERNDFRNKENCDFRIREDTRSNRFYLAWNRGPGRHPLAENIKVMGLAYGVDSDDDGLLDRWDNGPHLIWAVDSDSNDSLDTHLDTNNDGNIDEADDIDDDGRIDGSPIDPPLPLSSIKAVRVWLLAQSDVPLQKYKDESVYVVGDQLVFPSNDGYVRQLLTTIINCRNL